MKHDWDVIVIGAGIIGTAIARSLSRYSLNTLVVERSRDLGSGTSKANSAIIHTGFDAPVGSLEAQLLQRARGLWDDILTDAPIPWVPTGAYMLARTRSEIDRLAQYEDQAQANGVTVERVSGRHVRDAMPNVNNDVLEALWIPGERVVDPFAAIRAFAEQAAANGVQFMWQVPVESVQPRDDCIEVATAAGAFTAQWVVNAGGLWGDGIAQLLGDPITLFPRKGQFLVVEADLGIHAILLPVPTPISKGIIVTPIAFGGLLLGPTAEDQTDKEDWSTTAAGLAEVRSAVAAMVPALAHVPSIRQFAGLRAVSTHPDYAIQWSAKSDRVLHVLGIRSTGISASVAIAEHVVERLCERGLPTHPRTLWSGAPPLFAAWSADGGEEVLCACRSVTWGEIARTMESPLPAHTLDGIKRRSGAMLGECQGNRCMAAIRERVARYLNLDWTQVPKGDEATVLPLKAIDRAQGSAPWLSENQAAAIVVVGGGSWGLKVVQAFQRRGVSPLMVDAVGRGGLAATVVDFAVHAHSGVELTATNRLGAFAIQARHVVLATGAAHRPPGALGIPGDRPAHVYTPDGLTEFWRRGYLIGARPVLVGLNDGTEAILAWADRYRSCGIQPVVVISPGKPVDTARETSFTPIQSVRRIQGRHQFEAITVVGIDEEERTIPGDVLCFSGGRVPWMPYLKHQGLIRDERGRLKTTATGRTSVRGIWAVPPLSDVEEIVVEDLVADIMEEAAR